MTRTCDECGCELDPDRDKDNQGWWRDRCFPCIKAAAVGREKAVHQCDENPCRVCLSWRAEKREQAVPFLVARLSRPDSTNAELDAFR